MELVCCLDVCVVVMVRLLACRRERVHLRANGKLTYNLDYPHTGNTWEIFPK